ncbi:hypothetical protein EON65_30005 [archaeon]|nr:MAG: hypothetical protein EON65_30005 [archaeon]
MLISRSDMYVIALLVASLFVSTHHAYALEPVNDYAIVIDAGSTGSRCFVFHVIIDAHSHRNISSHPCGKVIPGLSSFATHPRDASAYIMPLLNIAATRIPASHHRSTEVHIKATAGMRLLPDIVQAILFNTLVDDLNRRSDMPFEVTRNSVGKLPHNM